MNTGGQECLPPFEAFVAAVEDARLGVPFSNKLLRDVYGLGKGRLRFARLAEEEERRSADLRKRVARLRKLVRRGEELAANLRALQVDMQLEGLHSQRFHDSTSRVNNAILEVIDVMKVAEQEMIDFIFPSRTHGLTQRWELIFRPYDLPRLGCKAADTWFILDAHDLLTNFFQVRKIRITKKQHWEILKTFVKELFKETVTPKAIEQLIRSRRKNPQ